MIKKNLYSNKKIKNNKNNKFNSLIDIYNIDTYGKNYILLEKLTEQEKKEFMEIYSNYKTTVDIKDNISNIIEVREKKIKTKCTSYTLNNINNEKNSEKRRDNDKENEILEVKDNIYDINYKTPKFILYNNRIFYKDNYYSKSTNSETFFCKKRRYNEHLKNGLFFNAIIKKIIFNNKIKYELKKNIVNNVMNYI